MVGTENSNLRNQKKHCGMKATDFFTCCVRILAKAVFLAYVVSCLKYQQKLMPSHIWQF